MGGVVPALGSAVERYGRSVLSDPLALAAALRAGTGPPSGAEVEQLVRAVAAGAVERLQAADGDREAAFADAVRAVDPLADPELPSPARWACTVLAGALGVLPASVDADVPLLDAPPTSAPPATPPARSGRHRLLVVVAVVALLAAGAFVWRAWPEPSRAVPTALPPSPPPAGAPAGDPTAVAPPSAAPGPFENAPADPRQAFADPALLAFAEPYLGHPEAVCSPMGDPEVNIRDIVTCYLGRGWVATFCSMLSPELALQIREGYLLAEAVAVPGTVRSLRWRSVPGRPGVKVGIPPGDPPRGEGTRIRYRDSQGYDQLYFDQDGTGVWATMIAADHQPRDDLRDFWADPNR